MYAMDLMFHMNRTTSVPNPVPRYELDKDSTLNWKRIVVSGFDFPIKSILTSSLQFQPQFLTQIRQALRNKKEKKS